MMQTEGIKVFWQGLSASMLGLVHVVVYFPLYEYLKKQYSKENSNSINPWDVFKCTMVAKTVTSMLTYPHEVIRA